MTGKEKAQLILPATFSERPGETKQKPALSGAGDGYGTGQVV